MISRFLPAALACALAIGCDPASSASGEFATGLDPVVDPSAIKAPSWQGPVSLHVHPTGYNTEGIVTDMNSGGSTLLAWFDTSPVNSLIDLRVAVYHPLGGASPVATLLSAAPAVSLYDAAIDEFGNCAVAWYDQASGAPWAAFSPDAGVSWITVPVPQPRVARCWGIRAGFSIPGIATFVWWDYAAGVFSVNTSDYLLGSGWLMPGQAIHQTSNIAQDLRLVVHSAPGAGWATAAWAEFVPATQAVTLHSVTVLGFGSWLGPVVVARPVSTGIFHWNLGGESGGGAECSWIDAAGGSTLRLQSAHLAPASGAWSAPATVLQAPLATSWMGDIDIAMNAAGDRMIAWRYNTMIASCRFALGAGWVAPELVVAPPQAAYVGIPSLALDPWGTATVAYGAGTNWQPGPNLIIARRNVPGTGWGWDAVLSNTAYDAFGPTVRVDAAGHATAVWAENRPAIGRSGIGANSWR